MLFSEYCSLVGNRHDDSLEEKRKDQLRIVLQITQLSFYLQMYACGHDTMRQTEMLTGAATIKEAESILKQWIIEKQIIDKEIAGLKAGSADSDEPQKYDMTGLVIEVSKYLGYPVNQRSTTVKEFAGMVKSFVNYTAHLKNKTQEK